MSAYRLSVSGTLMIQCENVSLRTWCVNENVLLTKSYRESRLEKANGCGMSASAFWKASYVNAALKT